MNGTRGPELTRERKVEFSAPLPRSKVYVTNTSADREMIRTRICTDEARNLFFAVLVPGEQYTKEMLENCQGRLRCYYGGEPILGRVYLYPQEELPTGEMVMNPIPHASPSRVLHTIQYELKNNKNELNLFFKLYGPTKCAPPRFVHFLPGALPPAETEQKLDDKGLLLVQESDTFRTVFAPIYLGGMRFRQSQLDEKQVQYVTASRQPTSSSAGPGRSRDGANTEVVALLPKLLSQSGLEKVLPFDPAGFRRSDLTNPHLGTLHAAALEALAQFDPPPAVGSDDIEMAPAPTLPVGAASQP